MTKPLSEREIVLGILMDVTEHDEIGRAHV